ncbi:MAG: hypothetical protein A2057_07450 [Ignavibacteria bacterium GWA2_35_9]|nr:MAG: hypothetical protein A2057_07450 [Ignavibacteria bacterium GWA2_35_9]OGU50316.1 MAG: hypothetical protein A2080_00140 [Ignavibacteria bacterium GWC2_36_12]
MKILNIFLSLLVQLVFLQKIVNAQEEVFSCPVADAGNCTQYINTTITLKILLVEFTDVKHRTNPSAYTKTDFENLLISSGVYVTPNMYSPDGDAVYGSLSDYFEIMSNGNLTFGGQVINNIGENDIPIWIEINNTKGWYNEKTIYNNSIFTDAINAANNEGLNTTYGGNTKLVIIYAGCTQTRDQFNVGSLNPRQSGDRYIMGERLAWPLPINEERTSDKFSRIGIHCHEFAHTLGIGHSGGSRADIMESTRNGDYAAPAPLNPLHRACKGWITNIETISGQPERYAYYSIINPTVYRINSTNNDDYFIIENRRFNQNMLIGSTSVPDYNNAAFFPPAWGHGTLNQGIFVWRSIGGEIDDYDDNGLIYASGWYEQFWPEGTPAQTGDGVPFPGHSNTRVLSPWSDSRNPSPLSPPQSGIFVPNTLYSENVGMEVLEVNDDDGYIKVQLYATDPEDASPSKPQNVQSTLSTYSQAITTWDANQEPDMILYGNYNIYRQFYYYESDGVTEHSVSEVKINSSTIWGTSYTDNFSVSWTGVPAGKLQYLRYKVEAKDNTGKISTKAFGNSIGILPSTISSNATIQSINICPQNSTVNSGVTLTVQPGTILNFYDATKLTVNGILIVNGNSTSGVTFTGSSMGSWNGIKFVSAVGAISYCDIINANTALFIENSSPSILYCHIDASQTGVYVKGSTSWPTISYSYIEGDGYCVAHYFNGNGNFFNNSFRNSLYGAYVSSGSPHYDYYGAGRNIFETSITGDKVYANGLPAMGSNNYFTVPGTGKKYIKKVGTGTIYANNDYWSAYPPSDTYFYGSVIRSNPLQDPPSNPPAGPGWALSKGAAEDFFSEYNEATMLFYDGKYEAAKERFKALTEKYIDSEYSCHSLNHYMLSAELAGGIGKEVEYLKSIRQYKSAHKNTQFYALKWLLQLEMRNGTTEKAKNLASEVETASVYDWELSLDLAVGLFEFKGDKLEAEEILDRLSTKFTDNDTEEAITFIRNQMSNGSNEGKEFSKRAEETGVPDKYELLGNYPNPFNPTTTIKYALPNQSSVELIIYDIMGREVKTFNISSQPSGYQNIVWDGKNENGSSVASGVYIYKLQIKSLENLPDGKAGNEIFVKAAKLMMLK